MINVTIGESKPQSEKPFPKLMKSKIDDLIVLFESSTNGVVIKPEGRYDIGHKRCDWIIKNFTDYNEPVTLQNA